MRVNISFFRKCADTHILLFGFQSPPPVISHMDLFPLCWLRDCPLHLNQCVCEVLWMIPGTLWLWVVWLIAGWPGVHVQPHCWNRSPDHAQGLCYSRVARQPRPPDVPWIYEVGCDCVSLGDWEVQLGEDSKDFCCFPVCSVPLLLECWFLPFWFGGMHFLALCYIQFPSWWEGLFL